MDKNAIKIFVTNSKKELEEKIKRKAEFYGLRKGTIKDPKEYDKNIISGIPLKENEIKARKNLIDKMNLEGYEETIEEITYTWFNRFIAIKFMESNGYFPNFLPSNIKILSFIDNELPIINNPFEIADYLELDKNKIKKIKFVKKDNKELFKTIIVRLCNKLNKYMPFLFEETENFTELLFPDNIFKKDSFLWKMSKNIPEDAWKNIEIVGWLYQFYNAEKKKEIMSKKKSYKKHEIPFVTQLFTPDWIVKYMTENSLGKLWVEVNPNTKLKEKWEYYIKEPRQDEKVKNELEKIKYKNTKPEEIKVIDPCCGSGHILVYAFDVLYDIYRETGELETEIPRLILKNNLFGLDIDKRAAQLAYFSLIMKARSKNKRFFKEDFELNISEIEESNELNERDIKLLTENMTETEKVTTLEFLEKFKDAKLYGSLLEIKNKDYDFIFDTANSLEKRHYGEINKISQIKKIKNIVSKLVKQAEILKLKYDVAITNPPYMGSRYMNKELKKYLEKYYPDSKSDLFAVFIERNFKFANKSGYIGMMSPFVWMFIQTYEKLRKKIIENKSIISLTQLEYSGFQDATVPICTFVLRNIKSSIKGVYIRLSDFKGAKNQSIKTLEAVKNPGLDYVYAIDSRNFKKIPGWPIAYWISDKIIETFEKGMPIEKIAKIKQGLATSDNKRFLRLWYEVNFNNIGFNFSSREEAQKSGLKWFPYNKGGDFRKWYGNQEYLVNWKNDGEEIRNFKTPNGKLKSRPQNMNYYFKEGITWTLVSSSYFGVRYTPKGFIFDVSGSSLFSERYRLNYILSFLTSKLSFSYLKILNPTLSIQVGNIKSLPIIFPINNELKEKIDSLAKENIEISKEDWDDFETSWNFKKHPFLKFKDETGKIENAYNKWKKYSEERFYKLKQNEEELNKIFLEIYDLADKISYEVKDEDITIRKADRLRDVKSFISYAIGCIMGRYSPDSNKEGLIFAGGEFNMNNYSNYKPYEDGILIILDDDYGFSDDITSKFIEFVEYTFGKENLRENLEFIAKTLNKNSSDYKETIRKYFSKNFYKDHTKMYKNKPIYWMFSSGKIGTFKALIYMHRYNENTIAKMRTDYLFKIQSKYEAYYKTVLGYLSEPDNLTKSDNKKYNKLANILPKYLDELREYDSKLQHYADKRIRMDLDDGVEENYKLFIDILEKIK